MAGTAQAATGQPSNAATINADNRPAAGYSQRELDEALWMAALSGDVNALTMLVREGANPRISTAHGETALHAAAARGHLRVVNFLLRQGVSLHARTSNGWTALHHAARFGHVSVANFLVRSGANPRLPTTDAGRKTPIQIALDKRDLRMARVLGW
ncbi:MAG: ankyrin repeat domain-containing protein [Thiolinea sp.]